MLWPRAKEQAPVQSLSGPKALRSSLVGEADGRLELQDLEVCELLGQGDYGVVHKVRERRTGLCRVMKTVVRPDGWDDGRLKLEAELLRQLDHPHILRIFAWFGSGDAISIVMEHCEGGELLQVVRRGRGQGLDVSERWLAVAVRQSFEALVYLHTKGVVHKDLKGQNILLLRTSASELPEQAFAAPPHAVLCDLGIAEVCRRGLFGLRGRKVAGTPATMAPEVWKGSCGPKSDVWSMGCVMFELFTNRLPFECLGDVFTGYQTERWLERNRRGPDWKLMECSPEALNLSKKLLAFKEADRPSASESLRHPWFHVCQESRLTEEEVSALCRAVLSWRQRNPWQRALCLKMAASCTCISSFASVFTRFDRDHSGILDRSEMVLALRHLGLDVAMAKKVSAALDVNGDNCCEYVEFAAACLPSLEKQFDELLWQEFCSLDPRGRGELRPQDFDSLLAELRPLADRHGLQLEDIDLNGDGVISFSEFCTYFGRPGVQYEADAGQLQVLPAGAGGEEAARKRQAEVKKARRRPARSRPKELRGRRSTFGKQSAAAGASGDDGGELGQKKEPRPDSDVIGMPAGLAGGKPEDALDSLQGEGAPQHFRAASPAPEEDVAVIDEGSEDGNMKLDASSSLPHPCSFRLSSDNARLITTSFVSSSVASFEKAQAAHCIGCLPMAAVTWLHYHIVEDGESGLLERDKVFPAPVGEPLPRGSRVVSL